MRTIIAPIVAIGTTVAVVLLGGESASAAEAGRFVGGGRFGRF